MNLPNKLTVGRILMTVLFVMALLLPVDGQIRSWIPLGKTVALVIFIAASLTDWLDGWLARRLKLHTNFGALMDPLADKILTTAAFICFIQQKNYWNQSLVQAWMVLVIISRDFLVTGLRLVARQQGVVLQAEKLGKHKTFSQMITIIVMLVGLAIREEWNCIGFDCDQFNLVYSRIVFWMMLTTVGLTVFSGIAYLYKNWDLFVRDA